jgi:hypothetical protein
MAAGYSATPLWKKLGVKEGTKLTLLDAPRGWSVPDLPRGAAAARERWDGREDAAELIVAFCRELALLREWIAVLGSRVFPDGALWVAWPRRAAGHISDIREQDIREVALPVGLVDVKVAALDEDWSGLRVVWRRERRQTSRATPG